MNLAQLGRSEVGEIVRIEGNGSLAQRLMALGFLPGCRVRVVQVAPFGDPIAVELNGWRLSLRLSDAARIAVEPLKPPSPSGNAAP